MANKKQKKQIDHGLYESELTESEITAKQKKRMIFLHLAVLFFAVTLFVPSNSRYAIEGILWLFSLYVFFDIAFIVLIVYVSVKSANGQKIAKTLNGKEAKGGFLAKHTFISTEVLLGCYALYAMAEIVLLAVKFSTWGLVSAILSVVAVIMAIFARTVTFNAYKNATFIPAKDSATNSDVPQADGQKAQESSDKDENVAEDFYEEK